MTTPTTKRLRELRSGAGLENRLGQVVRAMSTPAALSREGRAQILAELRRRDSEAPTRPRRWLAFAAAAAVLLLFAAGASALVAGVVARRRDGGSERAPSPSPSHPTTRVGRTRQVETEEVRAPTVQRRPARSVARTVAPTHPANQETSSSVGEESRLLARAIQQLRQERDPRGALASLDRYGVRFPSGVLRAEATLIRLDALTTIGDARAALATLDAADISGPRATELWVSRGELRSRDGRCREAIADFDRAIARRSGGRWDERALRGRAICRRQLGQESGARDDIREYLSRFPDGQYASELRGE